MVIFGADHIYRMNIRQMVEFHVEKRASVTIAAIPVKKQYASEFGVIETNPDGSVVGFHEKKADAPTMPGDPTRVYASMGNYIFSTELLVRELYADAQNPNSSHDFGKDILPSADRPRGHVRLRLPDEPHSGRSHRVACILARRRHARCLLRSEHGSRAVSPELNLYNRQWPLTDSRLFRCAREVRLRRRRPARHGHRFHRRRQHPLFPAA